MYPASSYTQISNAYNVSQHTDVESSDDEFSEMENDDLKRENKDAAASIPQLTSQIVEWSKERFETYKMNDDNQSHTKKFTTHKGQSR